MKFKTAIAAAVVLAAGAANAAIVTAGDASNNGSNELVLAVFDSLGKTYTLDLGLSLTGFGSGTTSFSYTVDSTYADFLSSNAGGLQWAVIGADNIGTGVGQRQVYSTVTTGVSTAGYSTYKANVLVNLATGINNYEGANNSLGTNTSQTNGSSIAAAATTAAFYNTAGNNLNTYSQPSGVTLANAIGATGVSFQKLANSATSLTSTGGVTRTVFDGTWSFDGTTLAYTVASTPAVPEPGTYAMLIAGLAAVGFVARRRAA